MSCLPKAWESASGPSAAGLEPGDERAQVLAPLLVGSRAMARHGEEEMGGRMLAPVAREGGQAGQRHLALDLIPGPAEGLAKMGDQLIPVDGVETLPARASPADTSPEAPRIARSSGPALPRSTSSATSAGAISG